MLRVAEVSDSARLNISLDGRTAMVQDFSASPPVDKSNAREYTQTTFEQQYGIYKAIFNKDYGIDVPAGDHTIELAVTKGDWLSIASITLTNYRSSRYADVNSNGMTDGRMAILWVQHPLHNWKNVADRIEIPALCGLTMDIMGLPVGRYTVSWWDTNTGTVTRRDMATATKKVLMIHMPDIATEVAAQITPAQTCAAAR